ncbi:class I SAM-dependent methyltransferase [Sphaerisporangium aureirubrum]|uniref:Class I SAM-dependent methyltransferase n=1 Tax=Sphaerisporangium aureirubrum TaxID=1544736 RepID=A0ABW1NTR2_9ACTN
MTQQPAPIARDYGKFFDDIAGEYDSTRPAYPDKLVDQACQGLGRRDHVLEIGCGTGQLTRSLLARGLHVTAVEPGKSLLALATRKLGGAGAIEFINARFEDVPPIHRHFAAVFSASALHWVDPEVSWRKIADVLVPGGTLALLSYFEVEEQRTKDDQETMLAALSRVAPEVAATVPSYRDLDATIAGAEQRRGNVSALWAWLGNHDVAQDYAKELFDDVQVSMIPLIVEHTADELNAILRTMSYYPMLAPAQRQALERENEAIYERLGRPIRSSTVATLVTAHAMPSAAEH